MATLALAAVGAAVGGSLLPTGISLLGATLSGAALGTQIGALAGSYVDQALFGATGGGRNVEGPRLKELHVTSSTEGAPITRIYGRARVGGQVIWADEIEEVSSTQSVAGGKGLGGGGTSATSTSYSYFASFAVAVCEGTISRIGRVWADGKELDLSRFNYRIYTGSDTQLPDDLIVGRLGAGSTPAFRGVAYILFERMALAEFGNRLPQLSFEVFRDVDDFSEDVRGVVVIPGSGEFAYSPDTVTRGLGGGTSVAENVHTFQGGTDWAVSMDQLEATLPNARNVSLITSWFGSDLRAQHCQVQPGVDTASKSTSPLSWSVAGVARSNAYQVSERDGRAVYGGTPSDQTVVAAIKDLKARGLGVTLTPFILMDIAEGNALSNPYENAQPQPAYPWRGRITCDPAPGVSGTPDKTAIAASQVANFVGSVAPADFSIIGDGVIYSGPEEWSFRRMVLHYAHLAKAAGGVDAFVIGTELRGLTLVRSSDATFPFVDALVSLAFDVKNVLGAATKITYAADWSEYFGYQPADGSSDVYFHLDKLWSSPAIDAIGIDLYWPLSDWRDGRSHVDYLAGVRSIYDLDYLSGNVAGGEGFDFFYASQADRDAQIRTPITDGMGKPWVFRFKDMKAWWSEQHYNRPGGIESASPTDWVPASKPIWLMEIGCPAVDKGANQPNVFVDPKSSETALPHHSRGARDDYMQRMYIKALTRAFDPSSEVYKDEANPISAVFGDRMLSLEHIYVYAWDARPFPAFPNNLDVWGDGENWPLGHWLNGRVASMPLDAVVRQLLLDFEFADFNVSKLAGTVPGYILDHVMSARDALQPLSLAFFIDALETGGQVCFRHRGYDDPVAALTSDDLVEERSDRALVTFTRGQETELPATAKVTYIKSSQDYRLAVAESRRLSGVSQRVSQAELPIVLDDVQAGGVAETWLHETWVARERARLSLPPSRMAVEPGDVVSLVVGEEFAPRLYRVTDVADSGVRTIEARAIAPAVYDAGPGVARRNVSGVSVLAGPPLVYFLDLPLLRGDDNAVNGYVVARQTPWPGSVLVYRSPENAGFMLQARINTPAILGITQSELNTGPEGRLDHATRLQVAIDSGSLSSVSMLQMLAGQNAAAVRNDAGVWEVIQFANAELIASGVYELSGILRGQLGTEAAMRTTTSSEAPFVLLDHSLTPLPLTLTDIGLGYNWRYGPATREIGDTTYESTTHAFSGIGLKPYAPAHPRAVRTNSGAGDFTISWIRRTRVGGDNWDVAEVPLGETDEAYEVEIFDGDVVKRILTSNTPSVVYSEADQTTDFGAPQTHLSVRIYQMSAVFGRGTACAAVF